MGCAGGDPSRTRRLIGESKKIDPRGGERASQNGDALGWGSSKLKRKFPPAKTACFRNDHPHGGKE